MSLIEIFGLQFVLNLVVYSLIARWYVVPWLADKPLNQALLILVLPHAFRHIGLSFLVPALNEQTLAVTFGGPAAYGDLFSGLIAIVALIALRGQWRVAVPIVWVLSIVGTVDLANALRQAEVIPTFGATWYIPTFIVPVLLVTHALIFVRLIKSKASTTA